MAIPTSQGPVAVEVLEDTNTALNGYTVSDADNNQVKIVISVAHGKLILSPTFSSLVQYSDSGRTITFEGGDFPGYAEIADINAALATMRYLPDLNYFGTDLLAFHNQDGSGSTLDTYVIDVKAVNDPPDIVSNGGFASHQMFLVEGTTDVTKVVAVDPEGDAIKYKISGGADANLFEIDAKSGKLTFKQPPVFSNPKDSNGDNSYLVTVKADDGKDSDKQDLIIDIVKNAQNKAPVINSDGGGDTAAVSYSEASLLPLVTQVLASDENGGKLKFSISGGADAAKFEIDSLSGTLFFKTPPDYENPTDAGANNVYDVVVKVSDGKLSDTQAIAVTVTNAEEAPVITSDGGGISAILFHTEGVAAVTTVVATDSDVGDTVTYAILGGADAALFTIDTNTGALSFIAPPDHAAPTDSDGDNIYQVVVGASDGLELDYQTLTIAVGDTEGVVIVGTKKNDVVNAKKTVKAQPAPTEHGDLIFGGRKNDKLAGLEGDDIIIGGVGHDKLKGNEGNDILIGGHGRNVLKGGSGADIFYFDFHPQGGKKESKIKDFDSGSDLIAFDHDWFPGLSPGAVADGMLRIGKKAKDDDDRLIYNAKNGKLSYDEDGVGGKKAVLVAQLDKKIDLHVDDLLVV